MTTATQDSVAVLSQSVVKEWSDVAKQDAKRYIREKHEKKEAKPIADYFAEKMGYYFSPENKVRWGAKGIDEQGVEARMETYNEAFWKSYQWHERENAKHEAVLARYEQIFREAEAVGNAVDVSDIKDGFPCGWVNVYLASEAQDSELGKALRYYDDGDSYSKKVCYWSTYGLPINWNTPGQCISFDERITASIVAFLKSKGIPASTHSVID